jgi:hypothetical protein
MKKSDSRLVILLVLPVLISTAMLSLLLLQFPNSIASPMATKLAMVPSIVGSNLIKGLQWLLFDLPLLAIEARQGDGPRWGVYWSLFDSLILLLVALLFNRPWLQWRLLSQRQGAMAAGALVLCWSVGLQVWLSGCCTAGPQWWLEVTLLARAYVSNPYLDTINWQWIYLQVSSVSPLLKTGLLIGGLLLWRKIRLQINQNL